MLGHFQALHFVLVVRQTESSVPADIRSDVDRGSHFDFKTAVLNLAVVEAHGSGTVHGRNLACGNKILGKFAVDVDFTIEFGAEEIVVNAEVPCAGLFPAQGGITVGGDVAGVLVRDDVGRCGSGKQRLEGGRLDRKSVV